MGMRQQSPIGLMMIMMDFQMISFGCFKTFSIIQNDYDVSFCVWQELLDIGMHWTFTFWTQCASGCQLNW